MSSRNCGVSPSDSRSLRYVKWQWLIVVAGLSACGSGSSDVVAIEVDNAVAVQDSDTSQAPESTSAASSVTTSTAIGASTTVVNATTTVLLSSSTNPAPTSSASSSTLATSAASSTAPYTVASTAPVTAVATTAATTPAPPPPPSDPVGLRIEAEQGDGYNRDLFRHWVDADGNGCDTRREVLIAESITPVSVGSGCTISGGTWFSIYDNVTTTDSSSFDIDHVVALKEAWDSGAWNWTAEQRRAFANDLSQPYFLIAVTASSNRSKSDRDPAEWLPTNTGYRCDYVRIWIDVKRAWNLSVDQSEHDALARILSAC